MISDAADVEEKLLCIVVAAGTDYAQFVNVGIAKTMKFIAAHGVNLHNIAQAILALQGRGRATYGAQVTAALRDMNTARITLQQIVWDPRSGQSRHLTEDASSEGDVRMLTGEVPVDLYASKFLHCLLLPACRAC